jgi:uncharacterized membrane protein YphA (DoxX/SURF4 family)
VSSRFAPGEQRFPRWLSRRGVIGVVPTAKHPSRGRHIVVRRLARPLLGAAFVSSGIDALRDGDRRAERARSYGISQPVTVSRAVAGTQVGAGVLLTLNKFPRLAAFALALTVVPEAATGHPFWTEKDREAKQAQRSLFTRDLGLLGGLLVAALDTGGRESVPHRAGRASRTASKAASTQAKQSRKQAKSARKQAKQAGAQVTKQAKKQAKKQVARVG